MLELNKIHLGDSYELIKEIPDKSVDLVVIDPPYNIETEGGLKIEKPLPPKYVRLIGEFYEKLEKEK